MPFSQNNNSKHHCCQKAKLFSLGVTGKRTTSRLTAENEHLHLSEFVSQHIGGEEEGKEFKEYIKPI